MNAQMLSLAAQTARGLAMDAVHACSSGHLGLPLGAAEIGAVLYGHALRHCPAHPRWINRDRFVLSAGHGSMFLYAWLHLSGYDLSRKDLAAFRALHSRTPGHPEFGYTAGVECTTGPLGQGVGNAVGLAVSAKLAAATFNTAEHRIFDARVVALAGDGCMQEGVALEAVAFAGHQRLDNLILIYDANEVTLDAMAEKTQSENTAARFLALGWDVQTIDGHDLRSILDAFERARGTTTGRPQLIIARTLIGKGIPEVAGTAKAHGEGGAKFIGPARAALGLPADEHFFVPPEVSAYFTEHRSRLEERHAAWEATFAAWRQANPEKAALLDSAGSTAGEADLLNRIPAFAADAKIATRKAGSDVLQPLAAAVPLLISGSADLHGSTLNYIAASTDFDPAHRGGRNFRFGIREHGMGAILNGIAYDGIFRASGATFLVFSDYLRPAIRLAALSHLPVVYIFTHDSVGVGEDGPTHQPVETIPGLRVIPNLDVIRPGDPEETAAAFAGAVARQDGPTLLALSRQVLPNLSEFPVALRREGTLRGGYVLLRESGPLERILIGTGTELALAVAAARQLGAGTRVVSMPSPFRFDRQDAAYRESVLPAACTQRVAVEAAVTWGWWKYVGSAGRVVGIDRFGVSAPGAVAMKELGVTVDAVVAAARS